MKISMHKLLIVSRFFTVVFCMSPAYLNAREPLPELINTYVPFRLISGFEPERIDGSKLKIFRGVAADGRGRSLIESADEVVIDLSVSGVNGIDKGSALVGEDYFVYALKGAEGEKAGFVVSSAISYGSVVRPKGYAGIRKLPWGFKYFEDGIRPFHLSYWPKPFTRYTTSGTTAEWAVLQAGDAKKNTPIDFSRFVPDNARMVYIQCVFESKGEAASAFISSDGHNDILVGKLSGKGTSILVLHERITSKRQLYYRVKGGTLSIYVLGYSQSEPS